MIANCLMANCEGINMTEVVRQDPRDDDCDDLAMLPKSYSPNSLRLLTDCRGSVANVFGSPQERRRKRRRKKKKGVARKRRKRGDGGPDCPAARPSPLGHRSLRMKREMRDAM